MNTVDYNKLRTSIRYTFIGMAYIDKRYYVCLKALQYAEGMHTGVRKDNVTKEFYHQLNIVGYLLTLHGSLIDPVAVYVTALLHDVYEDYPVTRQYLTDNFGEFMPFILRVSKIRDGIKVPYTVYFSDMSECHVTSVVKGADRLHNLSTMEGVFSEEKQLKYKEEVDKYFLPMLKYARRKFPEQTTAYENLKCILNMYCK